MRLKEIKEDMIIHCKTQEEANMLCEALGAEDKWKAYWKYAEDETCYHIHSNDICCYGTISSFTRKITEFSDLIIPDQELSAEEALLAYDQMCSENYYCSDCPIYGILGHECARKMDGHITEIVDAIKKWKADREKNDPEAEKKEPKIETVEFSDLIIPDPELSAEEALLAYDQMCSENYCCSDCPIYGILGHKCARKMDGHITEIVDAIKKWKADHEKKEPEIETVDICRIIEVLPDGRKRCVHEENMNNPGRTLGDKLYCLDVEEILKRYCMEHDGEYIAVHEVVSRVKAVE